ncbi:O-antigen ligase family protein [Hydrogenophaga sp. 5NK40-0174]|uniref:O-antigen ligase family protein n=1 Tax=Hydrogenophaga sp. 5NK40-0174 TaxID=3127649 RepID=UPI003341FFF5
MVNESKLFQSFWWWLLLGLLACAPGSTKLAGAGWLVLALVGLYRFARFFPIWWTQRAADPLTRAASVWLAFVLAAFLFKAIGVTYWDDPWKTRHFDLRMLLSAVAIFALASRVTLTREKLFGLGVAMALAAAVGMSVSYLHVNFDMDTPSNRINWAGGQVMLSWVLLSVALDKDNSRLLRRLALAGFACFWLAVLMSGARSAYLSIPWVGVVILVLTLTRVERERRWKWVASVVLGIPLLVAAVATVAPSVVEVPAGRIEIAVEEARAALADKDDPARNVDTPVGARIYMWQKGMEKFMQSPWIGYGREQRIAFIKAWGEESDAHIISDQFHLHSEYINGMVDHGLVGLASTVAYMAGLVVVAFMLRRTHPLMALALAGIAFTHITMSVTNANSQTNNYSVIFGWSLMTLFLFRSGALRREPVAASQ